MRLSDYFPESSISVIHSAKDWQEAIDFWSRIQRVDSISNVILSLNESPNDLVMHAG